MGDRNGSVQSRDIEQSRSKRSSNNDKQHESPPKSLFFEHAQNLPQYFAENILYLEMEIESNNVTIENVNQLLELYRIAIEYFESIKSDKFLIFKNRTQSLLMRSTVNQCMSQAYEERKIEEKLKRSRDAPINMVSTPTNQTIKSYKQRELEIQLKYLKEQDQDIRVNQIIENHGQQSLRISRQLNQSFQEQEDVVKQRLQRRRMQSVKLRGQKD